MSHAGLAVSEMIASSLCSVVGVSSDGDRQPGRDSAQLQVIRVGQVAGRRLGGVEDLLAEPAEHPGGVALVELDQPGQRTGDVRSAVHGGQVLEVGVDAVLELVVQRVELRDRDLVHVRQVHGIGHRRAERPQRPHRRVEQPLRGRVRPGGSRPPDADPRAVERGRVEKLGVVGGTVRRPGRRRRDRQDRRRRARTASRPRRRPTWPSARRCPGPGTAARSRSGSPGRPSA